MYRSSFKASEVLAQPHVMITVLVVAAETDEAARHLFTSIQQIVLTMLRGDMAGPPPPPVPCPPAHPTPPEPGGAGNAPSPALRGSRPQRGVWAQALIFTLAA